MGLWDILVPAEPGVLHNTIANPSFEYDTGQITKIYGKYSPQNVNTTYWNPVATLQSGTISTSAVSFPQNTPVTVTSTADVFSAGDVDTKYIFIVANGKYELLGLVTEYVTTKQVKIANYLYSSAVAAALYTFSVPTIAGSTEWASRGQKSLKIFKGITQYSGVEYFPRATPYSAPTISASLLATGGSLPNSTSITFAVMGLSDIGMSLANGITDAQVQPVSNVALTSHAWIYPSVDSRRGHGTLTYSNTVSTSSTTQQAQVTILDTSTSRDTSPRGWAVWYSTDAIMSGLTPTSGTFMLAGVYPNTTAYMEGTISVNANTTAVTGTGTAFVSSDASVVYSDATVGRKLYTTKGVLIGQISTYSSSTNVTLASNAKIKASNIEFRTDVFVTVSNIISGVAPTSGVGTISVNPNALNIIIGNGTSFTTNDIGRHLYINSTNNQRVYVGTIASRTSATQVTLLNNVQFVPMNSTYYLSTETNALSFPDNSQGSIRMFTVAASVVSPPEMGKDCFAPYWGITNAAYGGFTQKHHLYVDWYLSADNSVNPNTTYTNTGADWSVYLVNNSTSPTPTEVFIGKLDSTGTTASAKRMGLRTKFLIDRPAAGTNTSDMRLRFKYTGSGTSDAALYIDGVQFVDAGMIWRAYDWYGSTIGTSISPPQFSDWDWDSVEFSYIDGDTPGAMWADSMPTQSGTTNSSFPFIKNDGVWMRDQYEYEVPSATTNAGGYAGPRYRLNYQWRNTGSPVFGVSVPGLSQSSMQTQTFTTGFWAPLSTENINVIVEPTISGVGMPEISTTAVEYGIVDGGYVQRQVARMRNLQFTITISANSWTGLHANRRSLINLLKFDQLSQQGERRIRYRGADTPVWMSVTYQSGLEYSGTQGVSFTEALALRFLSTDPYFYVDANVTVDASPSEFNKKDFSHVLYKMGSDSEWMPLSHRYYTQTTGVGNEIAGNTYFFSSGNDDTSEETPLASGWIQSPSGSISALVVGGAFAKPVPYLAIFYVSGYNGGLVDTSMRLKSVVASNSLSSTNTLTVTPPTNAFSITGTYQLSAVDIGKHLFNNSNQYIGQIKSVNPNDTGSTTTGTFYSAPVASSSAKTWYLVEMETSAFQSLPNNVYLHNILSVNGEITSVYQESANTILVAGYVDNIIDMQASEPTTYGTGYISSQQTNSTPVYKNRIFRIALTDAGRISVAAVDDVFTRSSTSTTVTYTSSLYSLLYSREPNGSVPISLNINNLSKTPSNYVVATTRGNNASYQVSYDSTLPACINRTSYAFGIDGPTSAVVGTDPVGNAIVIGGRQTIQAAGKITTTLNSTKVIGKSALFITNNYVNRNIYTIGGLFIGKIVYVESQTVVYLADATDIVLTEQPFEISVNLNKIASDKRSIRSNLYATVYESQYSALGATNGGYYTSTWGYFNNPQLMGGISVVEGSRSIGTVDNIYDALGTPVDAALTITTTTTSNIVTIVTGQMSAKLAGAYILRISDNAYIGQIKEVTNTTAKALLYRNAAITISAASGVRIRTSRQVVDADGYSTVSGNVILDGRANTGSFDYIASKSMTDVSLPDFPASSFDRNGAVKTFKTPHLFSDATTSTVFFPTKTNAISKIIRRGVFKTLNDTNTTATLAPYCTEGYGIVTNGYDTPKLTAAGGTITIEGGSLSSFTMSSGFLTNADIGRSLYDTNKNFIGIIKLASGTSGTLVNEMRVIGSGTITVSGTTVTGVGTFFNSYNMRTGATTNNARLYSVNGTTTTLIGRISSIGSDTTITLAVAAKTIATPTAWAFAGLNPITPFVTSKWFPFQFDLYTKMSNDSFFSTQNQGITVVSTTVAKGTTTAITVNYTPNGITSTSYMGLYAYIAYSWTCVGLISSSNSTGPTITIGTGTLVELSKDTKLMIAPFVTIWSQSARKYVVGNELYAYENFNTVNYFGTIVHVQNATDSYAQLGIAPYTYSQKTGYIPSQNPWSVAAQNSMVWINNKQVRGSKIANLFADVIGVGSSQPSSLSLTLKNNAALQIDDNDNYVMPGAMAGVISVTSGANTLNGLNTSFVTTASVNNPVAQNAYLYTLDGRSIGQISVRTNAILATITPNATFTNTHVRYRLGSSVKSSGRMDIAANGTIAVFSADVYSSVSVAAIGTTTVENDTLYFGVAGSGTLTINTSGTITSGNITAAATNAAIFVLYGGKYQLVGLKVNNTTITANLLGVTLTAVNWAYSATLPTDAFIGRAVWASSTDTNDTTYIGVVKQLTTYSIVFDTSIVTNNLGAYTPVLTGTIVSSSIAVAQIPLKWTMKPGDVLRRTVSTTTLAIPNNTGIASTMIGQIYSLNIPNNQLTFTTSVVDAFSGNFVIQRGVSIGYGIGQISTITSDSITGLATFFSNLPIPFAPSPVSVTAAVGDVAISFVNVTGNGTNFVASDVGKQLWVLIDTSYKYVGTITIVSSTISVTLGNNVYGTVAAGTSFYIAYAANPVSIGTYVDIYATINGSTEYTLVGRATSYASDTQLNIENAQFTAVGQSYDWYYAIRNVGMINTISDTIVAYDLYTNTQNTYIRSCMPGLGTVISVDGTATITNDRGATVTVCKITGLNTITTMTMSSSTITNFGTTPTQFTYQIAPGDLIALYSGSFVYGGIAWVRVVQVLSDSELIVTQNNGEAFTSNLGSTSSNFIVFKRTDEMVAFDNGVTGYSNPDWQPLGYSNNHVYAIETMKNGDVYVGGEFDSWNKASSSSVEYDGKIELSAPYRMGKMVIGLNSYGYITDAYAAPVAGNTFVRNGFSSGAVNAIVDTSLINPINGYIGSSDTIMVGGSFTKTNDNIPLSSSIAVLPSSSISSSMRQILNTDLAVLNTSLTDEQVVFHIQSTTRARNYNDIVQTNVLDGINGNNISVIYDKPVTINHTTQYKAVRVRGNASTYPIITISYNTNSNLSSNASKYVYHIIQTVTGARIEFTNNALTVYNGETIIIDLRLGRRSISSNLRGNLANALSPNSNFVDFVLLGSNNSAGLSTQSYDDYRTNVIGVHADAGLSVTISYIPRFWSFDVNNLFFGTTKAGL